MNLELRLKLEWVARRIRRLRLWCGLGLCWLLWAVVGLVLYRWAATWGGTIASSWPMLTALALGSAAAWCLVAFRSARDQRAVARRIEARHPELATLLLAAVEQASLPRQPGKGPNYLQASVIKEALEHGRQHNWSDTVAARKLRVARLAQFVALGLLIAVCMGLASQSRTLARSGSSLLPGFGRGELQVEVDPGNIEIERGTSLLVVAQFAGGIPTEATLVVSTNSASGASDSPAPADAASAASTQRLNMVRSLDDPKFVGRVSAVGSDLTYYVEFPTGKSDTYRARVFDYPELVRADAALTFPEYTAQASTVVEDVRHVTAVEGTHLVLTCRLNKEVVEARLVDESDHVTELKQDATDKRAYQASWVLTKSQRFTLQLTDHEGRGSRLPAEIVVSVTPNRPPQIVIERPGRDVEVSPLEELQLQAKVTDDFGVEGYGVSYALGGAEPRELVLSASEAKDGAGHESTGMVRQRQAEKQRTVDHLIAFESLRVEADQLLSYYVWAEDFGPDGKLRRTMSDMYFAEVRPFEEVYRQGQQPSPSEQQQGQQGGGAAQQAGELAELQKEIINATWKLLRRETGPKPTLEFAKDSREVETAQQSALDRLAELAGRIEDAESRAHIDAAEKHMKRALEHLTAAAEETAVAPLRPALAAEQDAYQALLKLRAREFEVTRGQRQPGGGGGGGNRSRRQLDQLELSADENRYETGRRTSAPQQNDARRESRAILNRLKELAHRQDDLNQRLRELQSVLQQTDSQARREELERELKRLRDQQQEILRDTDELLSQMDRAQNQEAAQQARQQMDEGRSHVQQASEALEQGQLSQALTEGTRAGRQLNEVRDQFRQLSAHRFSDEMSELRHEAHQLDQEQQRLAEQLSEHEAAAGRTLRDTGGRAEARAGLTEQRRDLNELLQRMQHTVQEAEQPEPLLARQLYDTVREAHHERIENALDVTQRLLDVGIEREAGHAMRAANRGIRNLRQGVERAAESVLGDEAESLRRAQREVDQLADELNREISQARDEEQPGAGGGDAIDAGENQQADREQPSGQRGQNEEQQGDGLEQETRSSRSARSEERGDERGKGEEPGADGASKGQNESQQSQTNEGGEDGRGRGAEDRQEHGDERQDALQDDGTREREDQPGNRGGGGDIVERLLAGDTKGGGRGGPGGPITGDDFRQWADRIGDVEEMLDDPELRSEAARIRDRAADARAEFKRHSKLPDWTKIEELVAEPLNELSRRIGRQMRLRESPDSLVPIDRDPVPPAFSEWVRRYYERLGSGE